MEVNAGQWTRIIVEDGWNDAAGATAKRCCVRLFCTLNSGVSAVRLPYKRGAALCVQMGSAARGLRRRSGAFFALMRLCPPETEKRRNTKEEEKKTRSANEEQATPVQELPTDIPDEVRQKLAEDLNEQATEDLKQDAARPKKRRPTTKEVKANPEMLTKSRLLKLLVKKQYVKLRESD
mgnify:CR=1 FL=1